MPPRGISLSPFRSQVSGFRSQVYTLSLPTTFDDPAGTLYYLHEDARGSVTARVNATVTAASTAFPPSFNTSSPARVA